MKQEKQVLQLPYYERQPTETSREWESFCAYRDLGVTRNLVLTAKVVFPDKDPYQKSNQMEQYSWKWSWRERIRAYADYLESIRLDQVKKEVEEMVSRHADYAKKNMQVLYLPATIIAERWNLLQQRVAKVKSDPTLNFEQKWEKIQGLPDADLYKMPFADALKLTIDASPKFKLIADMERTSRGEPIEFSKQDITSDGESIAPKINILVSGSKSPLLNDDNQ